MGEPSGMTNAQHAAKDIEYVEGLRRHLGAGGRASDRNIRDLIVMVKWNAEQVIAAEESNHG
jgi:hypothetical protein